jgi:hypothetical protein
MVSELAVKGLGGDWGFPIAGFVNGCGRLTGLNSRAGSDPARGFLAMRRKISAGAGRADVQKSIHSL